MRNKSFSRRMLTLAGVLPAGLLAAPIPAPALERGINTEITWERLYLPATRLTFSTTPDPTFSLPSIETHPLENHDGTVDGARVDLGFGFATSMLGATTFGIKGFYGHASGGQDTSCAAGSVALGFCDVLPLVDSVPNPAPGNGQNVFGSANSGITYHTDRKVDHWGVALELQWGQLSAPPTPPRVTNQRAVISSPMALKSGLGYRRIDQNIGINAADSIGTTLDYSEKLNTGYLGAYVGLASARQIGWGTTVSLDGDIGLYWAHTDYSGTMLTSSTSTGNSSLSLNKDQAAVVASLKLAADKDFGAFKLGVFTRGEWYSYAPEMAYNSFDRVGTATPNISGPNDGTSINNGSAWTWSAGVRASILLN